MVTRGLTKSGQQICEAAGLKMIDRHQEKGIIYEANFENPKKVPRVMKSLFNAIQKSRIEKLSHDLDKLGEKEGIVVIKNTLQKWGYKIDGV
jgi:hypothetical protein